MTGQDHRIGKPPHTRPMREVSQPIRPDRSSVLIGDKAAPQPADVASARIGETVAAGDHTGATRPVLPLVVVEHVGGARGVSSAEATGVVLDEEQLERLADLIAERLAAGPSELIDAAELARRLGRTREFVYDHAEFFGGQRVGDGPRPRLLFRWSAALAAADPRSASERSEGAGKPAGTGPRRRRRAGTEATSARLLPVRGAAPPSEPGERAA